MRILQVCKKPPWPAKDGESIAISSVSQGLQQAGHEVHVAAISTPKHGSLPAPGIPMHTVFVDTRLRSRAAIANLVFSRQPYQIARFLSYDFAQLLQQLIRGHAFDVVQLEGLALAEYLPVIRHNTRVPVVMRAHNVEHVIWRSVARHEKHLLRRLYLRHLASRLKRYELKHLNSYDGLVPITPADADYFKAHGCTIPILPLATGLELGAYHSNGSAPRDHLFMFSSWDWLPNQEGLQWFIRDVWPLTKRALPHIKLVLAGRNAPDHVRRLASNDVVFVGEVEHSAEFFSRHGVMVVPLMSGSGLRIKIVEAMAAGVPTVSTRLGAQGTGAVDGEHLLLADDAHDFANAIVRCMTDGDLQCRLSRNAASFAQEHFDMRQTTQRLIAFYNSLMT